eukprot:8241401-Alexandrium_andersonii.AAC.2
MAPAQLPRPLARAGGVANARLAAGTLCPLPSTLCHESFRLAVARTAAAIACAHAGCHMRTVCAQIRCSRSAWPSSSGGSSTPLKGQII